MEKKKKILIAGVSAIIVIAIIITIIVIVMNNNKPQEESEIPDYNQVNLNDMESLDNVEVNGDTKTNISEKLLAERTFDGLTMKNISLEAIMGTTVFKATLVNNTDNVYEAKEIKIILKDKDGQEYGVINGLIEEIEPHGEKTIHARTTIDLSNAYDFTIEA